MRFFMIFYHDTLAIESFENDLITQLTKLNNDNDDNDDNKY